MTIQASKDGHIATVTIANPESLNAFFFDDMQALADIWDEMERDDSVRVVILTGEGEKAFCAGANLKQFIPVVTDGVRNAEDPVRALADIHSLHRAFMKDGNFSKPLLAAVNGLCFAGGVEILNICDIRIAVQEAVFSLQEPRWGLFPAGGSTVRLPRQLPWPWAMEILLVGGRLTAEQALTAGLINRVVSREELMPTVMKMAERIAANGPLAVRNIKRAALACLDLPLEQAFQEETRLAAEVFSSDDAREGPTAFTEKREPRFKGR